MVTNAEHALDLLYDLGYRPAYNVDNIDNADSVFSLILPDKFDIAGILASNTHRPSDSKLKSRQIDVINNSAKTGSKTAIIWKSRKHSGEIFSHKEAFLNHFRLTRDNNGKAFWDVDPESKKWERDFLQKRFGYGQGIDNWDVEASLQVNLGAGDNHKIYIGEGWIAFSEGGYSNMALLVFGMDAMTDKFETYEEDDVFKTVYVELLERDAAYNKWKAIIKSKIPNAINNWEI